MLKEIANLGCWTLVPCPSVPDTEACCREACANAAHPPKTPPQRAQAGTSEMLALASVWIATGGLVLLAIAVLVRGA